MSEIPTRPSRMREARGQGFSWIDLAGAAPQELESLRNRFGFHPLEIQDVQSLRQRNKIEHHEDHLFIILRLPRFVDDGPGHYRSQVCLFLGKDYLVTVHGGDLPGMSAIWESFQRDPGVLGRSPGFLVYRLLDALVDGLFPMLDELTEQLAAIEEAVFDERVAVIRVITAVRRRAHHLRSSIVPLKRVVAELSTELWGHDKNLLQYLKDVNDHVEKVWEKVEEIRETIEIYKDTDVALSTAKTNKILAVLTIAFTLAIPASVVGTFYGMNVNVPGGVQTGSWTFLGAYTAFIVVIVLSLVVPAAWMIWIFRRLKWI